MTPKQSKPKSPRPRRPRRPLREDPNHRLAGVTIEPVLALKPALGQEPYERPNPFKDLAILPSVAIAALFPRPQAARLDVVVLDLPPRPPAPLLPPGACLRCENVPSAEHRQFLSFVDSHGRPVQETETSLTLCRFCAATIRACLEKGTRLTPIVCPEPFKLPNETTPSSEGEKDD